MLLSVANAGFSSNSFNMPVDPRFSHTLVKHIPCMVGMISMSSTLARLFGHYDIYHWNWKSTFKIYESSDCGGTSERTVSKHFARSSWGDQSTISVLDVELPIHRIGLFLLFSPKPRSRWIKPLPHGISMKFRWRQTSHLQPFIDLARGKQSILDTGQGDPGDTLADASGPLYGHNAATPMPPEEKLEEYHIAQTVGALTYTAKPWLWLLHMYLTPNSTIWTCERVAHPTWENLQNHNM
jgi:hypothetical protein